jgi:deoxyribodipyrimidine photo-lyase
MEGDAAARDYPAPIVDHAAAARAAKARFTEVRRGAGYREAARDVYLRHGSRDRPPNHDNPRRGRAPRKPRPAAPAQLSFQFDD